MKEILTSLFTVEHIKVNAKNRKTVEKILQEHENRLDWIVWAIPILIIALAVIGLILSI